ncbi:MAG TPA: hypothetical protein PLB30_06010 [Thermoleophilia bacterium]|nr:hypothetical protein [Thermoleophilia bacterium]HQJ98085.1 hypothetical protein [Thermoleophilia bacterium]
MNSASGSGSGGGRQWRRRAACGIGRPRTGGGRLGGGRLGGGAGRATRRTVTTTFLALATSAAQDLRDPDGLTRPLLRRGAVRLAASPHPSVQRLGAGYLRIDPPTPDELARAGESAARLPGAPPDSGARRQPPEEDTGAQHLTLPPAAGHAADRTGATAPADGDAAEADDGAGQSRDDSPAEPR